MPILLRFFKGYLPELFTLALISFVYLVNIGQFSIFDSSQEIYFIQAAKEMALTGHWGLPQFNHQDALDKPPLFIWNILIFFKLFGVSLFTAKVPSFLYALLGIVCSYILAKILFKDRMIAIASATMLATSWGYFKMVHVATPDLAFLSLTLISATLFWSWYTRITRPQAYHSTLKLISILLGISNGLALILVGPIGIVFPFALFILFLLLTKTTKRLRLFNWKAFLPSFLIISFPWLIWVSYQDGHSDFLQQFFLSSNPTKLFSFNLSSDANWFKQSFFLFLKLSALFLPWSFFIIGPFTSYFARKGQRKVIDFREEPVSFLLLWGCLSLLLFSQSPSLLLPPLCLITAFFLSKGIREAKIPRSFVLSTEATILMMMTISIGFTVSLFQLLPDSYPQEIWQLPGISQWLLPFRDIMLPVWKIWLLPFPVLLIITGLSLFFFLSIKQYQRILETLAISALLFCLFINSILTPIFSRPAGEALAIEANTRLTIKTSLEEKQSDTAEIISENKTFIYDNKKSLRPQHARFLFTLNNRPEHPIYFINSPKALVHHLESIKPTNSDKPIYGLITESDYYQLDNATRRQFRIVKSEFLWHSNPFQLLIPSFIVPRNASLRTWDKLLLLESLQSRL